MLLVERQLLLPFWKVYALQKSLCSSTPDLHYDPFRLELFFTSLRVFLHLSFL